MRCPGHLVNNLPANVPTTVGNVYSSVVMPNNTFNPKLPLQTQEEARRILICNLFNDFVFNFREYSQAQHKTKVMAQPYVGEIRMFAGNFAPAGWMFCEGQLCLLPKMKHYFINRHHLWR